MNLEEAIMLMEAYASNEAEVYLIAKAWKLKGEKGYKAPRSEDWSEERARRDAEG